MNTTGLNLRASVAVALAMLLLMPARALPANASTVTSAPTHNSSESCGQQDRPEPTQPGREQAGDSGAQKPSPDPRDTKSRRKKRNKFAKHLTGTTKTIIIVAVAVGLIVGLGVFVAKNTR